MVPDLDYPRVVFSAPAQTLVVCVGDAIIPPCGFTFHCLRKWVTLLRARWPRILSVPPGFLSAIHHAERRTVPSVSEKTVPRVVKKIEAARRVG
jgi:hypothetical protein